MRVDEWIPEEMRWSNDRGTRGTAGGGGMDSAEIVNLIMEVIGGLTAWP